jgi:hypothetical protein
MRILFLSTKGLGYLRPVLPFATAARGRGRAVCVATPEGEDRGDSGTKSIKEDAAPRSSETLSVNSPVNFDPARPTTSFYLPIDGFPKDGFRQRPSWHADAVRGAVHPSSIANAK